MALPTITNNSPSAGYIAWTAFTIAYNGVSYPVAASNTNLAFTIWQYNAGAPTILKTNAFPSNLTADDQILFLNKTGVGALVPMTDVLDGSLVVPGSIIANAIAANTITSTEIKGNTITADEMAANSITGDELAFNSVTTEHLGVGSVGNSLITNGSFEETLGGIPTGWWGDAGGTAGTMTAVTGIATSGTNAVRLATPAVTDKIYLKQDAAKFIPVTAISGRSWYISAKLAANVPSTKGLYIRAIWYDANKQYITWGNITAEDGGVVSNAAVPSAFTTYEGQAVPPSTARYMSVEISVQLPSVAALNTYIDEVMAREVIVSAIIGDGQISTPKIATNAVVANHISANSITADKLVIGDFTNLIPNAQLQSGTTGWTPSNGTIAVATTAAGLPGLTVTKTTASEVTVYAQWVDCTPGEKIRLSFSTEGSWNTGNAGIYAQKMTAAGTITSFNPGTTNIATPGDGKGAIVTIPSDAVQVRFRPYISSSAAIGSYATFSNMYARRMAGGNLVVEGALDATKITGASILGGSFATTETSNAIAARMGPSSAWNPLTTSLVPGIGFQKVGFQEGSPAGMFSTDGTTLGLTMSNPGGVGGATIFLGNTKGKSEYVAIDGANGVSINSTSNPVSITGYGVTVNGENVTTTYSLTPLAPAGWSVEGTVYVDTFGTNARATMSVKVIRTGGAFSMPSGSYTTIGTVIPTGARSASGVNPYMPGILTGGSTPAKTTVFINTSTGQLLVMPDATQTVATNWAHTFHYTWTLY